MLKIVESRGENTGIHYMFFIIFWTYCKQVGKCIVKNTYETSILKLQKRANHNMYAIYQRHQKHRLHGKVQMRDEKVIQIIKKTGIAMLISDKTDFKAKSITKDKKGYLQNKRLRSQKIHLKKTPTFVCTNTS